MSDQPEHRQAAQTPSDIDDTRVPTGRELIEFDPDGDRSDEYVAELLTREGMLTQLDEVGADAGADYNDGDEVQGYFSYRVSGDVLSISHSPYDHEANKVLVSVTYRWRLTPIEDGDDK